VAEQQPQLHMEIQVYFFVVGLLSVFRSLPFGLALGIGRRSYYSFVGGAGGSTGPAYPRRGDPFCNGLNLAPAQDSGRRFAR
jgi:hypothetical protein